MWSISTIALFTTTPSRMIRPSMVMVSRAGWRASSRSRTPRKANGTENMIVSGWAKLSNSAAMIM